MTDGMSPGYRIVWIRLALEDKQEKVILNLRYVFYLPNNPSNLVSLSLLNDAKIFYNNKHHTLYNKTSRRLLAFAPPWEQYFLLHLLNLSISAINFLKVKNDTYQEVKPCVYMTYNNKLPFMVWHNYFGYLNFLTLRQYLTQHDINYIKDKRICNSCKRAKTTKDHNCMTQGQVKRVYQFIYTNFNGPITFIEFEAERYFFTFTDD